MKISKVMSAKGSRNIAGGVSIEFNTYDIIHPEQIVKLKFNDKDYYFEVHEVSTFVIREFDCMFEVKASELGYYNLLSKCKIDIRLLLNRTVEIVTDKDEINSIRKESCYC